MAGNHLFSSSQHGFRSSHFTETALITVSDHILSATDRQELILLCLLDLSKCLTSSTTEAPIQTSILLYRSDLVFLLPPWPYSICLYSWRAWEPTPLQSSPQSYRCIPRFLTFLCVLRPSIYFICIGLASNFCGSPSPWFLTWSTPLPGFCQRSYPLCLWGARGTVRWRYTNSTVRQKRLPPPAYCHHGAGHWIFGRLVPLPRSEGQHWKNRTHPFRLSSKLSWPRPYLHSVSRGHDPWGTHGEEPWRCVRQVPHLGLSRLGSRQKMQRYSHRAVPRASSDPDRPTAYIGQRSGPLARPILSRRLWKRIGEKHTAPPKSTKFCSAHCLTGRWKPSAAPKDMP